MALWDYNPIDAWNDVKSGWNTLSNLVTDTVDTKVTPTLKAAYKTPIVSKSTFNKVMDYNPKDLWNDIAALQLAAKQAYTDYKKGDTQIFPTPTGKAIPKEPVDFNSLKYLVWKAEQEK